MIDKSINTIDNWGNYNFILIRSLIQAVLIIIKGSNPFNIMKLA